MGEFETFLLNNRIDKVKIEKIVYECMLLNVFEKLHYYLSTNDNLFHFKRALRKCNDIEEELLVYKSIFAKISQVHLTKSEFLFIRKLTEAYMRKSNYRLVLSEVERHQILDNQNFSCNLCDQEITIKNAHIDHTIAFKYVGDELEGNYQALCEKCNLTKSSNLYYFFDSMLQKKSIAQQK